MGGRGGKAQECFPPSMALRSEIKAALIAQVISALSPHTSILSFQSFRPLDFPPVWQCFPPPSYSFILKAIKAFQSEAASKTFPSCCYLLLALWQHLVVPIRGQGWV